MLRALAGVRSRKQIIHRSRSGATVDQAAGRRSGYRDGMNHAPARRARGHAMTIRERRGRGRGAEGAARAAERRDSRQRQGGDEASTWRCGRRFREQHGARAQSGHARAVGIYSGRSSSAAASAAARQHGYHGADLSHRLCGDRNGDGVLERVPNCRRPDRWTAGRYALTCFWTRSRACADRG